MDHRLVELLRDIPNLVGVYTMYDKFDRIIYIGKSKHLKKRLIQHFQSTNYRELKIQKEVSRIEYELLGNEVIALLHESDLIKKYLPKYNRALRKSKFHYGLYAILNEQGYLTLQVDRLIEDRNEVLLFASYKEAKDSLFRITEQYNLCQKINGLYKTKMACFQYQLKLCKGACIQIESIENYNSKVSKFLESVTFPEGEFFLELAGRTEEEKGIIYLKNSNYMGFGFCPKRTKNKKVLLKHIELKVQDRDSRRIVRQFLYEKLYI